MHSGEDADYESMDWLTARLQEMNLKIGRWDKEQLTTHGFQTEGEMI